MRLVITGGGTGGHLFPGIALASAVRERLGGSEVLFIGTRRILDQQTLQGRGFRLETLDCGGMKGLSLPERLKSLVRMPKAFWRARALLADFRPDLVFGVGGYVTGPVLLAAKSLAIPCAIHEQNSVPGMANRLAGKLADRIFISLPCTPPFPAAKTVLSGNPVRREILALANKQKTQQQHRTLLVLGGSQGAHRLNMLMPELMRSLRPHCPSLRLIHQTGMEDEQWVKEQYKKFGIEADTSAFIEDMAQAYYQADAALSRAGATTLAELAVMGLPAILIPYPYAADNHQLRNASHYAAGGGALVVEEKDLEPETLTQHLAELLTNDAKRMQMGMQMRRMGQPNASGLIVSQCLALAHTTEQTPAGE